jgi:Protein of unknown function (DUF3040)
MSNQEGARLTAWERAALAELENAASAEDPGLDVRLQRGARFMPGWQLGSLGRLHSGLGVVVALVGLALAVLSLSVGLVLGVVGAALTGLGLASTLTAVRRRVLER